MSKLSDQLYIYAMADEMFFILIEIRYIQNKNGNNKFRRRLSAKKYLHLNRAAY